MFLKNVKNTQPLARLDCNHFLFILMLKLTRRLRVCGLLEQLLKNSWFI
jgi:hypothetical protein